jgi:hypothetical protein
MRNIPEAAGDLSQETIGTCRTPYLANKEILLHLRTIHHLSTPFDDPGMVVDLVKLLIISFALAGAVVVPLFLLHTIYRAIRGIRAQ